MREIQQNSMTANDNDNRSNDVTTGAKSTAKDVIGFYDIAALAAQGVNLPISKQRERRWDDLAEYRVSEIEVEIISSFYQAVCQGNVELVSTIVSHGIISLDDDAESIASTSLRIAIDEDQEDMVRLLLLSGVSINALIISIATEGRRVCDPPFGPKKWSPLRQELITPLMYAAKMGKLKSVKLLIEDLGADDAIIGRHGALALRLAANAHHKDIVDYLPVRRGGGLKRWRRESHRMLRHIAEGCHNIAFYTMPLPLWDRIGKFRKRRRNKSLLTIAKIRAIPIKIISWLLKTPSVIKRVLKWAIRLAGKFPFYFAYSLIRVLLELVLIVCTMVYMVLYSVREGIVILSPKHM